MELIEVVRRVRPTVVALGSRLVQTEEASAPGFPRIIGTGFIADERGIVVTNEHVVQAICKIPAPARFVMLFPEPVNAEGQTRFGVILRKILKINSISRFESNSPFFGQPVPDFAFVQIDVQGLPTLEISDESYSLQVGAEVATIGLPSGEKPLTPFDYGRASQISPFVRRGIISSVLPCPCPDPHGFSMDVLSEGGASGSPIFLTTDPRAIGILHAGFDGAPITYGVPGHLIRCGLEIVLRDWDPDLNGIAHLSDVIAAEQSQGARDFTWSTALIPQQANVSNTSDQLPPRRSGGGGGQE
jgi:hypothetical protein